MLTLSRTIERDLERNDTFLQPLIILDSEGENPIYISTTKQIFHTDIYWEDYGLKINSIKESIDLENRKFKIKQSFTFT